MKGEADEKEECNKAKYRNSLKMEDKQQEKKEADEVMMKGL